MIRLIRLWRVCASDLRLLWYALGSPHRPIWLWPIAVILGLYALEPLNFEIPLLGLVDDFVLLPLALHVLVKLLPREIRAGFAAQRQFGSGAG